MTFILVLSRCTLNSRQQRCARTVCTLCHPLERRAVIVNIHKDNAAAWRLHSAQDSAVALPAGVTGALLLELN